ncbi:MAG TPA: hypothetical protein VK971_09865 [Thiohalobacter sp.]|nr:hypothetical protein [Thiohalobacter sp.]
MTAITSQSVYPEPAGPEAADSPPLQALLAALHTRFGDALQAVVLYGSCLRSADLLEGVVDLYALVDDHARAEPRFWRRLGIRLLPPNVYYLEAPVDGRTVRCKYAVLSLDALDRGTGPHRFESYLWGRFAQPVKIVYSRTPQARARLHADFLQAAETLLRRALPALPPAGTLDQLWEGALALSYATELRTERQGRAGELAGHGQAFYTAITLALAGRLADCLTLLPQQTDPEAYRYRSNVSATARRLARWQWRLRRVQGKPLSLARLVKGLFTFEGGLDYLAWKLSRHSGQPIEVPARVRRRPLIHVWRWGWQLYRRGIFR